MGSGKWAKFAQYVAPRTCLHSLVFLHFPCFPFARRSMTCLPRFSAVSLWEEATSRRFVSGWGEPFVVALCILRRSELCWTFCEWLSKEGMLWQEGVRSHNLPGQLRNAECCPIWQPYLWQPIVAVNIFAVEDEDDAKCLNLVGPNWSPLKKYNCRRNS